ncbi:bacterial transcriptional activator domain-containing protein [Frankia sp. CiP3]|uniref:AfsR/SARP family transcriptional regulator n=1 Tax=Frankia sp. CiP3 TaxID=2880971 RepID=UPI001EF71A22|nr:bacterial transcriptional activator domain-containing protein [Frankia sp. CiP3]
MEFELLDGVRISGGEPGARLAAQPQAFLAALCLADGHRLTKAELAEWVWDKVPAAADYSSMLDTLALTVRNALRSELRVPGTPGTAVTDPLPKERGEGGYYRLAVEPVEVDVLRFRNLADQARTAAGRDAAEAANHYRSALDVWPGRGETLFGGMPLGGLSGKRVEQYQQRLRREHRDVLIDYLDLQLAQDCDADLVGRLARLARTEDGRSDADVVRLLMCAHHKCGDLAKALAVHENMAPFLRPDERARRLRDLYEGLRQASAEHANGSDASARDQTLPRARAAVVNNQYGGSARNFQAETMNYYENGS